MKLFIVLLFSLTTTGCFYQATSPYEISLAQKWCAKREGVRSIHVYASGASSKVTCNNSRKRITIDAIEHKYMEELI